MIIKDFYANATGEIKIDSAAQVEAPGNTTIVIVKVIPCREGIADLRNKLDRGLREGMGRREEDNG